MTYPRTAGTLPFVVDLPRYRWELGEIDGEECLIPRELIAGASFVGSRRAFQFLSNPQRQTAERILAFANANTGLLAGKASVEPEPLWRWQAESSVLSLLVGLRGIRLADLEIQRWSGRSAGAPPRRAKEDTFDTEQVVGRLMELLPVLRPQYPAPASLATREQDALLTAWIEATAAQDWGIMVPFGQWARRPIRERAANLAPIVPEVRCRTLLGYAYAELLFAANRSVQILERSRSGRLPGVDDLPGHCMRCGCGLEPVHPDGRKRRHDAKWCNDCRVLENTDSQRRRRAK